MNRIEAGNRMEEIVKEILPDAYVKVFSGAFGKTSLCLSFATSKTFPNNIINNDSGHTHLWIHDAWNEDTGEQVRPFTLDSTMYGYSNYKNGYKNKCKFKKINKGADWAKIEKALISYFTEMKTAIETDKGGRG